jgi:hypothetical protein
MCVVALRRFVVRDVSRNAPNLFCEAAGLVNGNIHGVSCGVIGIGYREGEGGR